MLSDEQAALLIKFYQTIRLNDEQQERLCDKYWDASPSERAEIARVYAHYFAKDAMFIQRLLRHHDERRQLIYEREQEHQRQERQHKQSNVHTSHSQAIEKANKRHIHVISANDSYGIQNDANTHPDVLELQEIESKVNTNVADTASISATSDKYYNNDVTAEITTNGHATSMKRQRPASLIYNTAERVSSINSDVESNSPLNIANESQKESCSNNNTPKSDILTQHHINHNNSSTSNFNSSDDVNELSNMSDSAASPTLSISTVSSFDRRYEEHYTENNRSNSNRSSSNEQDELSPTIATNCKSSTTLSTRKRHLELGQHSRNNLQIANSTGHLHSSPTLRLSHSQLLTRTAIQDQFPKLIGDGPFCIAFRLVQNDEQRRAVIDLYASQFSHPDPPELQRLVMLPQSVSTRTRRRVTGSCTWFIECITTHEIVCAVTVTAHHHKIHHFVEMPLFATAAGYKRNGFGRLLNSALASWCASAGFEFTMVSADAQAIAFWEHLGYVRMSRQEKQQIAFYYEHECYKFKKAEPMIGYCTWRELGAQGKSGILPLCHERVETVLQKMHRFVMAGPLELPNP